MKTSMYVPKLLLLGALLAGQLLDNAHAAAPVVNLVQPTNGASFGTRSSIRLRLDASVSSGTLSNVSFFAGTNLLRRTWTTLTNVFAEATWTNVPAGMHQLHAEAEDNVGNRGLSASVQITVTNSPPPNNLPVVSLIQPQNATTFPAGAPILLRANASDSDGTLTNIDFFANAALLGRIGGTLTNGVYSLMWSNPQPGMYSLRAEAVDDADGRGVSAPVQVSVSGAISNCQFSITVPPGFSMIANQCNNTNAGGNTLNNLYPGVPAGSKITKWNQAGQVFEPSAVFSGDVWSPNLTLNPGEGAFFENPTASPITLTSSGATPTPNLPLALPSPGCSIVSRQQPLVSGYNDIVGLAPQPGDLVFRFASGIQSYLVYVFDEFELVWINGLALPEDPMANVGESIWVCRGGASPPPNFPTNSLPVALGTVDLGIVEVPSIGHVVNSNAVVDFLVDQDQSSGGGGVLSSASVNWDTNNQFKLTVAAPPDMKFQVTVPPGSSVRFGGYLWWESTRGGFSGSGPVTASFADLEGIAPVFDESNAVLSDSHGFFGIADLEGTGVTNSFAFTAITLTGTVAPQYTGNGTEDYVPHLESSLFLVYSMTGTNDPGSFVSLLPTGPLPRLEMRALSPKAGAEIVVIGRPGRTHIVECSPDTVKWIAISSAVMPPKGSMSVNDASASTEGNRFYRVLELP